MGTNNINSFIIQAVRIFENSSYTHVFILILSFIINKKKIVIKILACWINLSLQRKMPKIYRTDFIFVLISRHFIGLVWYFTGRSELYQRKKLVPRKFKKIQLKICEQHFLKKSWIWTWISAKIQRIDIWIWIFMNYYMHVFFFGTILFFL